MATNKLLQEKSDNYQFAKKNVDSRLPDFNEKDDLYLGHVDASKVISRARVTDSMAFRLIIDRASRVMANKPRGHFSPREGGDLAGSRIVDEYLSYNWDKANHGGSMVYKWWLTVMGALKYGTAFYLVPWRYERKIVREKKDDKLNFTKRTIFEGPEFTPLLIRDCFPDPSANNIKDCKYFDVKSYMTLAQMEAINDVSVGEPFWKNLDKLREVSRKNSQGDSRDSTYESRAKIVRGVEDYTGKSETEPVFELITEHSPERRVTFSEKHHLILRDIPNPLYSGEIPIGALTQYPLEDDLYGLGELEPVKRLLRASSSLINQALDETNMKLYSPLKIDPRYVQTNTIKWTPGAKWLVSDMNAIQEHQVQSKFVQHFVPTYSFMLSAIQNATGTTDLNMNASQARSLGETATGTRFIAQAQNTRDNLFRGFLEDQIKWQMEIWLQWIQQYAKEDRVIRVVGKEAMEFFREKYSEGEEGLEAAGSGELKFRDEKEFGFLTVTPDDIAGSYDFIPEVGSTQDYDPAIERNNLMALAKIVMSPITLQLLQTEGQKLKVSEWMKEMFLKFDVKNPDRFFEQIPAQPMTGGPEQPGMPPQDGMPPQAQGGGVPPQPPQAPQAQSGMQPPQPPTVPQGGG